MAKLIWLADVLRNAGQKVEEIPGWTTRGGEMGEIKGVLLHHTAGPKSGNIPSLRIIKEGRPGLRGPLSHLALGRDGTWYVVSAGRSNHAGRGSWKGITQGNYHLIGVEAENTGVENDPWPQAQIDAYAAGVGAILEYLHLPAYCAIGHKEWAPRRKIDPSFDMNIFREKIGEVMARKKKSIKKVIDDFYVPEPEENILELTEVEFESPWAEEMPSNQVPVRSDGNKLQGKERAIHMRDLLINLGWDKTQAAALTAQAIAESKLDTGPGKSDPKYSWYGIMRWDSSRTSRLVWFKDYVKKEFQIDEPMNSLDLQVRFVDWELRNVERIPGRELNEAKDMMTALRAAIGYVRPLGWSAEDPERGAGWKDRVVYAYQLMND